MTTTPSSTPQTVKYLAHGAVLGLWVIAGLVFTFTQLFASQGLGATVNYWLWFVGFAGVTTLAVRFVKSAVVVLIVHAAFALLLNLIPTTMPWSMLRAGYDLLVSR
jgi:hypothetical protein